MSSTPKMERLDGGPDTYECDCCDEVYTFEQLEHISDLTQRIDPGGVVPAGQCPDEDCGALCYPVTEAPPPQLRETSARRDRWQVEPDCRWLTHDGQLLDHDAALPADGAIYMPVVGTDDEIIAYVRSENADADARLIVHAAQLLDVVREADEAASKTMHKPAGRPAYASFVIPAERWERVRALLAEIDGEVQS